MLSAVGPTRTRTGGWAFGANSASARRDPAGAIAGFFAEDSRQFSLRLRHCGPVRSPRSPYRRRFRVGFSVGIRWHPAQDQAFLRKTRVSFLFGCAIADLYEVPDHHIGAGSVLAFQ